MTAFLCNWAKEHSLPCKTDAIGNVCITRPASPGKEDVPTLVLQAHQDMVCEKKPGFRHDFSKDPVPYEIEDGWMIARNTTLGADDGIGIAACLALMESDKPMGKVESIFTISEETGMDGAFAMEEGFFTGKTLINLDSEDEGQLFIGCAGGEHTDAVFNCSSEPVKAGSTLVSIEISGGVGGHSGDDINKHRANTVKLLSGFLAAELEHGFQLVSLEGGGKSNAIARECKAVVATADADGLKARFEAFAAGLKAEYATDDAGLVFTVQDAPAAGQALESGAAVRLVRALDSTVHGVVRMSPDIPGLVQTSTNLAAVKMTGDGKVKVFTSQRSSTPRA